MKKYEQVKMYILQDGRTEPFKITGTSFVKYDHIANIIRDKRKLLFEISRRGNICLTFKDVNLILTDEQAQQICGLRKNLRIFNKKKEKT